MIILLALLGTTALVAGLEDGCVRLEDVTGHIEPKVIAALGPGNLYSPGFERNEPYPDSVVCAYQFHAMHGLHVRIRFNELDIAVTDSCQADSLLVYDFNAWGRSVPTLKLCGSQRPRDIVSSSYAIQIVFTTDAFASGRGFNITYSPQTSSRVCPTDSEQCRNRKCVPTSALCDGNDDCGDGTDEEGCGIPLVSGVECGVSEVPVASGQQDRIVGGQAAAEGSWPWMADLQAKILEPNGHVCGGSLINSQWVLTAAHCVMEPMLRVPDGWRIHLGNYRKFDKDEYEQIRYVERIVVYDDIHPAIFEQNGEFEMEHDMALLKLNAPVRFTKHVKPICLGKPDVKLNITSNCFATGWGATRGTGSSDVLKQAPHPVQDGVLCTRLVDTEFIPETMICAGSMAPMNGACHGDSGGPLQCDQKGVWSVYGVASYVTDTNFEAGLCGLKARPTVFNKVAPKLQWISEMIDKYS